MAADVTKVSRAGRRARRAARDDDRLGDPPGARGRAEGRLPARGDRGARAGRVRGDRARDGRGRELQQRLGGARQAGVGVALRRPPRVRPPHRRLGRLGRRLEGRRGRHALEARRRGRDPLQPGLLRGRRGARPRPARRAVARRSGATRPPGARSPSSRRSRRSSCCRSRRTSPGTRPPPTGSSTSPPTGC